MQDFFKEKITFCFMRRAYLECIISYELDLVTRVIAANFRDTRAPCGSSVDYIGNLGARTILF